jgi:PIN domain nuclease of toxin-antitoxin system
MANYLLDTHVLLWWLADAKELPEGARRLISDPDHILYVSAASIWEMRIKQRTGKLELPADFASALAGYSFEELPITHAHAHAVEKLPLHHRDPFDRMLIAQAKCEALIVVTRDRVFERYGISTEMV